MMMILMIIIILMIMMMTAVLAGSPRWRDGEGVAGSADDPANKQTNKQSQMEIYIETCQHSVFLQLRGDVNYCESVISTTSKTIIR